MSKLTEKLFILGHNIKNFFHKKDYTVQECYIVYIPQDEVSAIITKEERDNYIKKLNEFDKSLTVDYSDDTLPFYSIERELDNFEVRDALFRLKCAEKVSVRLSKTKKTFTNYAYNDYKENNWWLDKWIDDFNTALELENK